MKTISFLTRCLLAGAVVLALVIGPMPAQERSAAVTSASSVKASPAKTDTTGKTVNINQASLEQLATIKGIGPVMAKRILEFREKNGPFKKAEDLLSVKGIGEKKLEMLKGQISL
jgi:competence protein ComEA